MSSIRDALRRAERERRMRPGDPLTTEQPIVPSPPTPDPPREFDEIVPADPAPQPRTPGSQLRVVATSTVPLIEVPVEFSDELALFRRGVEAALPQPRRSLLLTSATRGEGVTTLGIFLASSLAVSDGKKTCLIDANFKSPRMTHIFGLLGRPGLSDYCAGRRELSETLVRSESPDLFVMGLGTEIANPSLTLSQERARGLARMLSQRFDYVLFDVGPVLSQPEAGILSPTVDGVVLVVRAHRTKREVLAKAEKSIRFNGGSVIGSVLNRRSFPIPEAIYKRL
jgi:protein-tyrosine kinase